MIRAADHRHPAVVSGPNRVQRARRPTFGARVAWCALAFLSAAAPTVGRADSPPGAADSPPRAGAAAEDALDREALLRRALAEFDAAGRLRPGSGDARNAYRRAAERFASIIQSGVENGCLYYNMANAYARAADVGRAIVNYRRALRLMPGDARIRHNLESTRRLVRTRIDESVASGFARTVFFWHFETPRAARLRWFLVAYGAFWAALIAGLLLRRRMAWRVWAARAAGAAALALGASLAWEDLAYRGQAEGVVIADEAALRKGNGEHYEPQLTRPLTEGVEFEVLELRPDAVGDQWLRVRLRDGRDGWLRADQAELI